MRQAKESADLSSSFRHPDRERVIRESKWKQTHTNTHTLVMRTFHIHSMPYGLKLIKLLGDIAQADWNVLLTVYLPGAETTCTISNGLRKRRKRVQPISHTLLDN